MIILLDNVSKLQTNRRKILHVGDVNAASSVISEHKDVTALSNWRPAN